MKIRNIVLLAIFSLIIAITANAQAAATKVAFINTEAFLDDKTGITRYVSVYKALEAEFKPAQDELMSINTKLDALTKDIQNIQKQLDGAATGPPIDKAALQKSLDAKNDEGQNLQLTFKRKQEDAKAKYEKREKDVTAPIVKEIALAIDEFRKKLGYDVIFDISKSNNVVSINDALDITPAFIKEFNAKPAPAAK